jgi:glycosyltransferase involved in cell wall biosynthesis
LHFRAGDAAALAGKLQALANDPDLAGRLGRAAYEWYWSDPWSRERHVEEVLAVYRRTLDAVAPPSVLSSAKAAQNYAGTRAS